MKLIIAGSRTVSPTIEQIDDEVCELFTPDECRGAKFPVTQLLLENFEVVSGTASGADVAGERWAKHHAIPVKPFPANWTRHGKAAGKLRNRQMAEYADAALVFWDGMSSGSCDMVTRMVARGKPVRVVPMRKAQR